LVAILKGPWWLFGFLGDSHGHHMDLPLTAIPPGGDREEAGIRLTIPGEDATQPERRIEAMPTGHTFRVWRGSGSHPESEVSVLRLATEFWTAAMGYFLSLR
jgi:hypothetical protein